MSDTGERKAGGGPSRGERGKEEDSRILAGPLLRGPSEAMSWLTDHGHIGNVTESSKQAGKLVSASHYTGGKAEAERSGMTSFISPYPMNARASLGLWLNSPLLGGPCPTPLSLKKFHSPTLLLTDGPLSPLQSLSSTGARITSVLLPLDHLKPSTRHRVGPPKIVAY